MCSTIITGVDVSDLVLKSSRLIVLFQFKNIFVDMVSESKNQ